MSDLVNRLKVAHLRFASESEIDATIRRNKTISDAADRIEALEIALGNMIEHYINVAASVDCYGDPSTDNVVLEARAILKEVANV